MPETGCGVPQWLLPTTTQMGAEAWAASGSACPTGWCDLGAPLFAAMRFDPIKNTTAPLPYLGRGAVRFQYARQWAFGVSEAHRLRLLAVFGRSFRLRVRFV